MFSIDAAVDTGIRNYFFDHGILAQTRKYRDDGVEEWR